MTPVNLAGADQARALVVSEFGEIQNLSENPSVLKVRAYLLPEEEAASLPPPAVVFDQTIALLNRMMGARLTVDNPAWIGDPVPRMRALQKKIIEHSLTQEPGHRSACMAAISLVEKAVGLRLRWQQMRKSDAETEINPKDEKRNEKTNTAYRDGG